MSRPSFYRPELDGLRFLAFLSVYIGHAFSPDTAFYMRHGFSPLLARMSVAVISSGRSGVPLFFLLSSYLITELLIREEEATGQIHVRSFYFRRALRIWPLHILVIVMSLIFRSVSTDSTVSTGYLVALLLFVGNWFVVLYATVGFPTGFVGHLWSVSVEEQFYLVWPWVLRRFGTRQLKPLIIVVVVFATVCRIFMCMAGFSFSSFWYNTISWIDTIAAGALLTSLLRRQVLHLSPLIRLTLLALGPVCWTVATVLLSRAPVWGNLGFYPLITSGSMLMLVGTLGGPFLKNKALIYLGRISYGLYVFHLMALAIAATIFERYSPQFIVAGLVITSVLAAVSYQFFELPFLRLKERFTFVRSVPVSTGTDRLESFGVSE